MFRLVRSSFSKYCIFVDSSITMLLCNDALRMRVLIAWVWGGGRSATGLGVMVRDWSAGMLRERFWNTILMHGQSAMGEREGMGRYRIAGCLVDLKEYFCSNTATQQYFYLGIFLLGMHSCNICGCVIENVHMLLHRARFGIWGRTIWTKAPGSPQIFTSLSFFSFKEKVQSIHNNLSSVIEFSNKLIS